MYDFGPEWGNSKLTYFIETAIPTEISWWPQGDGWLVISAFVIVCLCNSSVNAYRRYQRNRYRRDALTWLQPLLSVNDNSNQRLVEVPTLLRKTAIAASCRNEVIGLHGRAWEQWLDQRCPDCTFSGDMSGLLHQLAYGPNQLTSSQLQQLLLQVQLWIQKHRNDHD
ncbi:DUF4381 domain-containing protein [Ferrimonas lipolytica]|uniref:DUF4381 domain-containing protein n=1 Tax=Ferrimonas lipolytica TaxID=2724191 RepID=A0A6H1UE96_9GAMM|nr:DUF4381 domain-containing protein [Ferrimonas lipolytica]QIZ76536.1 DUF4381 domain-containing protein [Ferrimonas lipolytica]